MPSHSLFRSEDAHHLLYSGAGFKTVNATEVGAGAQAYITKQDANSLEKIVGQHIL
jgi:hypothetical protein